MEIERYEPDWYFKEMRERVDGCFVNYKSHKALVESLTNQMNMMFQQLQLEQEENKKLVESLMRMC